MGREMANKLTISTIEAPNGMIFTFAALASRFSSGKAVARLSSPSAGARRLNRTMVVECVSLQARC